jgi:hypothetical protein
MAGKDFIVLKADLARSALDRAAATTRPDARIEAADMMLPGRCATLRPPRLKLRTSLIYGRE